jgi:hypothetical protein
MRGWWRRPRRLAIALATIAVLVATAPAETHEALPTGPVTLQVQGSSLGNVTTSGLKLTPAFTASTTDYALRCGPGTNTFRITLAGAPGGTIQVGSQTGPQVSSPVTLVENQALVVNAPDQSGGTTSYWIRCLPSDFPPLAVTRPGLPPPGWYLTGNLGIARGSGTYAMILDSNGTPVWYQKTAGQGAINVTPVARNSIAWASNPGPGFGTDPGKAFGVYDLGTQETRQLTTPAQPLDFHELLPLENGHRLLLASPLRAAMDLRRLGFARNQTIVDCLIEEVNAEGGLVWSWRASDHIDAAESLHPDPVTVNLQRAYDIYHCNSIDQDPLTGDLLLSTRHADAVYRIKRSNGAIVWKLGGNPIVGDRERHLTVRNDPEQTFHAQHDARFQPGNDISLFDNHTWYLGAARGVEYHIDTRAGTGTLVWQYPAPDGGHSAATGGFRRYQNGNDNLITWGIRPNSLFTEVDAAGNVLLNVTFPNGDGAYRTIKTPLSEFDAGLLRRTAGLQAASFPPVPRVLSVGVETSRTSNRSNVTIRGTGFTGASAVTFGSASAPSFSVQSDSLITTVAPPGSGAVGVTVQTPGGTSKESSPNMLVGSDGAFTTGTGSWEPNVNATVALSREVFRSRPYSLEVKPPKKGFCSALTSEYPVAGNAEVTGAIWAKAPRGRVQVRSALVFHDALGSVLWIRQPRFTRVTDSWARVSVSGVSPAGAASVALAVDGLECETPLYIDDASLAGRPRFVYLRSALGVTSVGPDHGSRDGGTVVTITGGGFSKATSVRFGASEALSFTATSDSSITAVAPPGSGSVEVTVTTPNGTSPAKAGNVLTNADATFEQGPGSWVGNVNASVVSSTRARTGAYSVESRPLVPGFHSVISGVYPSTSGAVYKLGLWVDAPGAPQHVRPFMTFYGPAGEVLSIEQAGALTKTSAVAWTRMTLAARSPEGTAAVAVGVESAEGGASLYLDDVTLTSSLRFTYR